MHLALIHQSPIGGALPSGAVVWRTCLREVAFLTEHSHEATSPGVEGRDAYTLLVEIVSGLRSPLVGETEVQAQFKAFLSSLDPAHHASLHRLGQRVLRDARVIRRNHLQGVGAHSYGRLTARYVRAGVRVAVVGTGALAFEVIATLGRDFIIDQWGRSAPAAQGSGIQPPAFRALSAAASTGVVSATPGVLIIAAPASREDLDAVAACYPGLESVIDLRAERERTPLALGPAVGLVTLDDLFADAGGESIGVERVRAARADAARLGDAYASQEELHPFGWDDVCA